MSNEQRNVDADDYVLVTESDTEENPGLGEKPEVIIRIKEWLAPTEFESDNSEYKKHLYAHVQGTGQWILATDQYRRWYDTNEVGDLWIRGIPGSGKSVVAANLVRQLKNRGDAPVLFFFFRQIIVSNRSPTSLMRDCSFQLLDHSYPLQSSLKRVMKEHSNVDEVPADELWKCFSSALSGMNKVYCVVDALDEMDLGEDAFLSDFLELGRRNPKSIKLALTSRQLPYLEAHLKGTCLVDLRLDRRNVDKDISTYISHRLGNSQVDLSEEEAHAIKQEICDKGKGLFLYARLMMDECLQDPKRFLSQKLPDGLGNMYTDLLLEHATRSGTTQDFQKLVLGWVTHSLRPLRLIELTAVINSLPDRGGLTQAQDTKLTVRSCCGPLLEICEDEVVQIIHHSFTEFLLGSELSHIQMTTEEAERFPVLDPPAIHRMISLACINYLMAGCFKEWTVAYRCTDAKEYRSSKKDKYSRESKELTLRFNFVQYAAQHWPHHAAKVARMDSELFRVLDVFLSHENHDFESWKDIWLGLKSNTPAMLSPLHIIAHSGLTVYAEYLLARGADPNAADAFQRTPLFYAAMESHDDAVKVLLKHGARNDSADCRGLSPIHYAAKMNHAGVIRVLLASGVDPLVPKSKEEPKFSPDHSDTTKGETALFYSCSYGHTEALVELQKYIDPIRLGCGPLHWAAAKGRAEVVHVLLQHEQVRLRINNKDTNGNTPLYLAARARDPNTVKALLDYGADVNARSEAIPVDPVHMRKFPKFRPRVNKARLGYTPLHGWARLGGNHHNGQHEGGIGGMKEVLELLVDAGCDIDAQDDEGCTALFSWSSFIGGFIACDGEAEVAFISWLLDRGANATATNFEGGTPLHEMKGYLKEKTASKMLVDAGADINAVRKSDGQTPLIAVAKNYKLMDPTIFHEFSADFDRQDHEGNTALHYACSSWCMTYKNAETWLSFADPTILNYAGRSALTNFAWGNGGQGRVDAISLMVKKGLDLESRDYLGRTPLLNFLTNDRDQGNGYFVRELLKLGANVRAKDYQGKSALHLFARYQLYWSDEAADINCRKQLMQDLINAGSDINAIDYLGNTIFHDAIVRPEWSLAGASATMIVKLGGNIKMPNLQGRTGLHIAAEIEDLDGGRNDNEEFASHLDFVLQSHLGFDVNTSDHQGVTPLHLASTTSEINVWKLIRAGANVQMRDIRGRTALHYASQAGKSNIVDLLVDYYREKSLSLDGQDLTGRTSLHEAARSGRSESVKALLDGGAVVDIRDRRGRTPLHAAAEFEEIPASRVLQHDYDKKDPFMKDPIVCYFPRAKPKDAFDKMDLILSNERDAKHIRQVVRLLLAGGADAGALDDNQHTPSDVAIMLGTVAVVDELAPQVVDLYSGPGKALASTGLQSLDPLGEWIFSFPSKNIGSYVKTLDLQPDTFTLLERAISYGNVAIVEEIVREKRPPLIRADGSSPIHLIARWGLTVMMEKLLSYIDDIQAFSPPLLHVATERVQPNTEMIKLLIKCGVDVNAEYRKEPDPEFSPLTVSTAIHKLATGKHWWHPKALSILLDAGADPKIENEAGRTALQVALSTGSSSRDYGTGFWSGHSLEVLLKHGAEVNFLSSKGLTPLNTALQQNRGPHILQKLLDYGADGSFGPVPATASAVDSLDYTSLEMLLKAGANPNVVYKATSVKRYGDKANFETLLMNAACPPRHYSLGEDQEPTGDLGKRSSIISLLLQYGADPLHPLNDCSTSVLHEICAVNGLVKPMLARGVDLGRKDSKGRTPLLRACDLDDSYRRSIETEYTALVLIESGVDIHAVDDAGLTALHLAIESNLPKTTKKLLEHGVSATVKDNIGLTPLYYAFTKSKYFWESMKVKRWAVETLLDAGANALERGPEGQTSLHYLAPRLMQTSSIDGRDLLSEYRRPDSPDEFAELSKLYERCIKAGCDREARDNNGNTPLFPYVAAIKSYSDLETPNPPDEKDLRKMFAEHDIHAVNNDGDTLLHVVARRPDSHEILDDTLNLFKLLVELGLDPRKENKHQITALDMAAACGNEKVLALFARNE